MRCSGHQVLEALSVSEVLHLCEHRHVDAVIIAPDVGSHGVQEVTTRHITVRLTPQTTVQELAWELSLLFPRRDIIQ
jgi:predicted Fe-Mo cluster-binding NifX family protein